MVLLKESLTAFYKNRIQKPNCQKYKENLQKTVNQKSELLLVFQNRNDHVMQLAFVDQIYTS